MSSFPLREFSSISAGAPAPSAVGRTGNKGTRSISLPAEPKSVEDTGLNIGFLSELILKHVYFAGLLSGQQLEEAAKLPFLNVIDKVLIFLKKKNMSTLYLRMGIRSVPL